MRTAKGSFGSPVTVLSKLTLREQAGAGEVAFPFVSRRARYCVPGEERATS